MYGTLEFLYYFNSPILITEQLRNRNFINGIQLNHCNVRSQTRFAILTRVDLLPTGTFHSCQNGFIGPHQSNLMINEFRFYSSSSDMKTDYIITRTVTKLPKQFQTYGFAIAIESIQMQFGGIQDYIITKTDTIYLTSTQCLYCIFIYSSWKKLLPTHGVVNITLMYQMVTLKTIHHKRLESCKKIKSSQL